ncbi:MAG: MCE family protein [Candidatus Coatesbacteria bacterium]|nr:MCE family protein [Candidatus Coatesbacteria bacterium]
MKSQHSRELRVGLFLLVAIALFTGFVFSIGGKSRLLQPRYHLVCYFGSVSGLVSGAPVMLEGVDVGTVEDIRLLLDPLGRRVRVNLSIESRVQDKIRSDSRARIETMGLLGDKYIEITMGSYEKPIIEDGTVLKSIEPIDYNALMMRGQSVLGQLDDASGSLKRILKKIDEGKGLAGAVVNEEIDFKGAMDSFMSATRSLDSILEEVRAGSGALGLLLYDSETRDNLAGIISSLDGIMAGIQAGKGSIGKLVKNDVLYERLAVDVGESARLLKSVLETIQSGEGLIPKLLNKEGSGEMLNELEMAIHNLNSVAQKIDSGEGSLGKLINDPEIYDDLVDLLRGAKKSWFIKRLVKKGKKKAEESEERENGGQPED